MLILFAENRGLIRAACVVPSSGQNEELKILLQEYLGSKINQELYIPPTLLARTDKAGGGGGGAGAAGAR